MARRNARGAGPTRNNKPNRRRNTGRRPNQGQGSQAFLPFDPQYEAEMRALADQFAATNANIGFAQQQVPLDAALYTNRLETDRGFGLDQVRENMIGRGVYGSGFQPGEENRLVNIPIGRDIQDVGLAASRSLADLAAQQGEAQLGYNQGMGNIYAGLAARQTQNRPLNAPGGRRTGGGGRGRGDGRRSSRRGRR